MKLIQSKRIVVWIGTYINQWCTNNERRRVRTDTNIYLCTWEEAGYKNVERKEMLLCCYWQAMIHNQCSCESSHTNIKRILYKHIETKIICVHMAGKIEKLIKG